MLDRRCGLLDYKFARNRPPTPVSPNYYGFRCSTLLGFYLETYQVGPVIILVGRGEGLEQRNMLEGRFEEAELCYRKRETVLYT